MPEKVITPEPVYVLCPECKSPKRFYHCYDGCNTAKHVVTCRACKTMYSTTERHRDYVIRTKDL